MDMNMMMNKVVEEGTARRAQLEGIKAAGKTGTTNAHRDAWFVGFTGNFVLGVWFGNDDYSPMQQMTGGSLPAQTWREIMTYAHQGIELKQIPGVGARPPTPRVADKKNGHDIAPPEAIRPTSLLTRRGAEILARVERMMDDADARAGRRDANPPTAPDAQGKRADARPGAVAASEPPPTDRQARGN